jgi:DNA-binding MarR family transcriptional regulator
MREYPDVVAEFDLTPVQAHVLRTVTSSAPMPMSTLANFLSCDASNVTGLIDRMEARGLVERRSAEHDRRIKMLLLTKEGEELRDRLMARLAEPPTFITALSGEELRILKELMRRALSTEHA